MSDDMLTYRVDPSKRYVRRHEIGVVVMADTANEPISEKQLAEWRQQYSEPHNSFPDDKWQYIAIIRALLAEVERRRTALAASDRIATYLSDYLDRLSIENAQLRAQINGTVDEEGD